MKQGILISGIGHAVILLMVVFGVPWVTPEPPAQLQVTEVTVMSEDEFAAAVSSAPIVPQFDPTELQAPQAEANDALRPDAEAEVTKTEIDVAAEPSEADQEADLSAFENLMVQPTARVDSTPITMPTITPEPTIEPLRADQPPNRSPGGFDNAPKLTQVDRPVPRASPRIDSTPDIAPPEDAKRGDQRVEAVETAPVETPEETPIEKVEEVEAQAPEESVSSIEPEAREDAEPTSAPATAALPLRRSSSFKVPKPAPEPEPEKQPEDTGAADDLLSAAIAEAVESASAAPAVEGPPLTAVDIIGLNLAISNCWKVPVGIQGLEELVVVLGMNLSLDGYVIGGIRLVEPKVIPDGRFQVVYDAAAQAIKECEPYALPAESYDYWKELELVFDPSQMENY